MGLAKDDFWWVSGDETTLPKLADEVIAALICSPHSVTNW